VKPWNIVVRQDRRATLVDFGLAKRLTDDPEITDHGHVVGTYRYMSPEHAPGGSRWIGAAISTRWARPLFELLAGRPAYAQRNQLELLEAIVYRQPPEIARINPGAPAALARLAERLLQKRPDDRPQHAAEVAVLLRVIGRGVWGFSSRRWCRDLQRSRGMTLPGAGRCTLNNRSVKRQTLTLSSYVVVSVDGDGDVAVDDCSACQMPPLHESPCSAFRRSTCTAVRSSSLD